MPGALKVSATRFRAWDDGGTITVGDFHRESLGPRPSLLTVGRSFLVNTIILSLAHKRDGQKKETGCTVVYRFVRWHLSSLGWIVLCWVVFRRGVCGVLMMGQRALGSVRSRLVDLEHM